MFLFIILHAQQHVALQFPEQEQPGTSYIVSKA